MINTTELRVYMARRDNMPVNELAKRIGKSPATLSRWLENRDMPVSYAEKIATALEIPQSEWAPIFFTAM